MNLSILNSSLKMVYDLGVLKSSLQCQSCSVLSYLALQCSIVRPWAPLLAASLTFYFLKVYSQLRSGGRHPSQSSPFRLGRVGKKGILPLLGRTEQSFMDYSTPGMASSLVTCVTDILDTGPGKPYSHPSPIQKGSFLVSVLSESPMLHGMVLAT